MENNTMIRCTRCHGDGWDPHGGSCNVCDGAGALYTGDGAPAKLADADAFFEQYREQQEDYRSHFRF